MEKLSIGTLVRRNKDYKGNDYGVHNVPSSYFTEIGEVIDYSGITYTTSIKWHNGEWFNYYEPHISMIIVREPWRIPDELFEI
jgi:hypothetical protein